MISRLANVIYWGANTVAALLVGVAVYAILFGQLTDGDRVALPAIFAVSAVMVWIIGRASLYVMAGK